MNLKKISIFFQRNLNYLIIIAVVLSLFAASFGTSFLEMLRLIKLKNDLISQIAENEELSSQLDEEIAQIGTQSYIERIARQYLELYYPDEQIVIPVENSMKEQAKENQKKGQQENQESSEAPDTSNLTDEYTQTELEPEDTGEETVDEDQSENESEPDQTGNEETLDEGAEAQEEDVNTD